MPDEPLTPLEESAARTGRRFWRMRESNYTAFGVQLNQSRGFPKGRGTRAVTERALPPVVKELTEAVRPAETQPD